MAQRVPRGRRVAAHGAFTLVELMVVLLVVALLAALLLPALGQVRASGRQTTCAAHLHAIGTAWHLFAHDHDESPPHAGFYWYADGTYEEWFVTASADVWRGDWNPPAWSGYGLLLTHMYAEDKHFFCPGAMRKWVTAWHEHQLEHGTDLTLVGSIDRDRIGMTGLRARSTYYQRGLLTGAVEATHEPQRKALIADHYFQMPDAPPQRSHRSGLNVLYSDTSVNHLSRPADWNITFHGDVDLIDDGWSTWFDLD